MVFRLWLDPSYSKLAQGSWFLLPYESKSLIRWQALYFPELSVPDGTTRFFGESSSESLTKTPPVILLKKKETPHLYLRHVANGGNSSSSRHNGNRSPYLYMYSALAGIRQFGKAIAFTIQAATSPQSLTPRSVHHYTYDANNTLTSSRLS
jgi:hypothetical protein